MARLPATLAVALSAAVAGRALAVDGDAARGERTFQRCFSCHSVDPNETAKLQGPSLYRVIGRRAGAVAGFEYSPALRAAGAGGLVWLPESIERLIADPEAMIPGTRMGPVGGLDAADRADVVAYLAKAGR